MVNYRDIRDITTFGEKELGRAHRRSFLTTETSVSSGALTEGHGEPPYHLYIRNITNNRDIDKERTIEGSDVPIVKGYRANYRDIA